MSPTPRITVALVEDDLPYRNYLAALIDSTDDWRVSFSAGSAEEGLQRIATTRANVLLLDVKLPGITGAAAVHQFLAAQPDLLVIMLTAVDADDVMLEALRAGACGYVLKGADSTTLLAAIEDAIAGGAPMTPAIAKRVLALLRAATPPTSPAVPAPTEKLAVLTPREHEVLSRVVAGYGDKEIAAELGTAVSTVKNHLANIYTKWRVQSRTEAAVRFLGR